MIHFTLPLITVQNTNVRNRKKIIYVYLHLHHIHGGNLPSTHQYFFMFDARLCKFLQQNENKDK